MIGEYVSTAVSITASNGLVGFKEHLYGHIVLQIDVPSEAYKGKRSSENGFCDGYTISRIPKTNVFVIRVKSVTCLVNADMCPCTGICTSSEDQACECPCKAPLEYDICNANLTGG